MLINSGLFATDYHVAKTGDDSNAGTEESPFLTIGKAASIAVGGDVVIIHEGTYEETIRPANSGTDTAPIVFRGVDGDRVIVTTMQALEGFTQEAGDIYKVNVGWNLRQSNFVMNGSTAMDLARWPNNTDGNPFTLNSLRNDGGSPGEVSTGAFLTDSDIPDYDWTGGSIFFYGDRPGSGWLAWKEFITSSSSGRVNFDLVKSQSWIRTFHPPADGGDYYLEGVRDALDYENEWWFDESNRVLYVQIPNGEAPEDGQIQMRRRQLAVDLNGRNHIHLEDFAVFGGGIEINGDGNRLFGMSSFYGSNTRGIYDGFAANQSSVFVKWNASNTVIERCEIAWGSGSGIQDAGDDTRIENNYVHDFDFLASYDAPMLLRDGNRTIVHKNTVRGGGRSSIQMINKFSRISYNDISESNRLADDCALFYTINVDLNMEIDHNWFHNAYGRGDLDKAAGIYLDNDPGKVKIHHNVIYDTEWSSIQMNWDADDIDIFNNTLWDASAAFGAWHLTGTSFSDVRIWNNLQNNDIEEAQADKQNNLILEENATPFTNEATLDFSLVSGAAAIDFGREIAGFTDGFQGAAPDAGAYESGAERWVAGVDWDILRGPSEQCYDLPGERCSQFPVSTNDLEARKTRTIEIFPNPTADLLFFKDLKIHNILRIYDMNGRMVTGLIRSNDFYDGVDVSDLTPGIYIVTDDEGGFARFIKE